MSCERCGKSISYFINASGRKKRFCRKCVVWRKHNSKAGIINDARYKAKYRHSDKRIDDINKHLSTKKTVDNYAKALAKIIERDELYSELYGLNK